jgi:hypothetical protein
MKVDINGKQIKFGFGLYFLGKAQSHFNKDLGSLLTGLKNRVDIVDLMYVSAKSEAYLDDEPFEYTKREWVKLFIDDNVSDDTITQWETKFAESIKGLIPILDEDKNDEGIDIKKK